MSTSAISSRCSPVAIVLIALVLCSAAASAADLPPYLDSARLDVNVPAPKDFLDHAVGADAVRYDRLKAYCMALADASDFVTMTTIGRTHEGRDLFHLTITSRRNHDRLDAIRADAQRLADPRGLADADGGKLVKDLPGIAWLAYSIHGDEVSPSDSAMVLAYLLAAGTDRTTRTMRDELVIHIDPLMNPDGRERYLAQIQTLRGKNANTDIAAMHHAGLWSAGRGNHYLFDLNRDWLPQAHPETRARSAAILGWRPHLLVDAHEMGGLDTYLFDPPREPLNLNMSQRTMTWRRAMSADQAAAFDRKGWSYYTQEWYEEWYPGYTNAWATLNGAIGLLYEQAGVNGGAVRQAAGNVLTYAEAVEHNVVSSFANLETLRANRAAILADLLRDRRDATAAERDFHGWFLFPPDRDASRRARFTDLLDRHAIESVVATEAIAAEDVTDVWGEHAPTRELPAGTLAVSSAQPQRAMVHAALGFDPHMTDAFLTEERHELENGRGSRIYDITGWNLPMAYGLEAYHAGRVARFAAAPKPADAKTTTGRTSTARPTVPARPAFGWLVPWSDGDAAGALAHLLRHGVRVRAARKPFRIGGRDYARGTLLVRRNENAANVTDHLAAAAAGHAATVIGLDTALAESGPDLGGNEVVLLHEPRVAIASQWPTSTTSFGSTWFLLDARIGLAVSPVNIQAMPFIDLRKYNVIILPSSYGLDRVLDEGARRTLRTWVEGGGTLIAIGGSADALAREDGGLSTVRRRRDVLEELPVYAEAVARERAARHVTVDPDVVWGDAPAPTYEDEDPPGAKVDPKSLARRDAWARRFRPQGAIVAADLDPEHWLCFGLGDRLPVLAAGGTAYVSRAPAATPVRLVGADDLRLSGLLWPEARERLADSAWATVESVGNGQVVLFANDPFFRGYWEGTGRLLTNAVLLGPGFGTSQPVPW